MVRLEAREELERVAEISGGRKFSAGSSAELKEVYASIAEFGDGIYGAQAAARSFFRKDAAKLSAAEAARLAAVLPSPKRYNAARPGPYVQRRTNSIQRQMRYMGGSGWLRTLD